MNGPRLFRRPTSAREEMLLAMSDPEAFFIGHADADLTAVVVPSRRNILISGVTGSGKSTELRIIAKQVIPYTRTAIIAFDPHSQLTAMHRRLTAYWTEFPQRVEGLRKVITLLEARLNAIYEAEMVGSRVDNSSWDSNMGPWVYVFIDEIAEFMLKLSELDKRNERKPEWDPLVTKVSYLVSEGRKAGILVIATAQKLTNAITSNPLITIGLPTKIAFEPDDSAQARHSLGIEDQKSPESDTGKWLRPGHGATFNARTRTIKRGLIRFQTPMITALDLREAADEALELGVRVYTEAQLFKTHDHRRANY